MPARGTFFLRGQKEGKDPPKGGLNSPSLRKPTS